MTHLRADGRTTFRDRDGSARESVTWFAFVGRLEPTAEALDPPRRRIADGEDRAIFTNRWLDWFHAPHDGGADVIAPTVEKPDALESRYAEWLSAHPSGL